MAVEEAETSKADEPINQNSMPKEEEQSAPINGVPEDPETNFNLEKEENNQPISDQNNISEEEEFKAHHINANTYQIAMLNKMIPKGYRFDIHDIVKR
jgi:hypothetical protein